MGHTQSQAAQQLEIALPLDAKSYQKFVTYRLCWNCSCRTSRKARMEYRCPSCKRPVYYESQIKEWRSLLQFARDEPIRGSSTRSRVSAPTVHMHFDRFRLQLVTIFVRKLVHDRSNLLETDDTLDSRVELIGEKSCQIPLLVTPEWIVPIRPETADNPAELHKQHKKCMVSSAEELMARRKVPASCRMIVDFACDRIRQRRHVSAANKCLYLLEGSIRFRTDSDRIIDMLYRHAVRPEWTSKLAKRWSNPNCRESVPCLEMNGNATSPSLARNRHGRSH